MSVVVVKQIKKWATSERHSFVLHIVDEEEKEEVDKEEATISVDANGAEI